MNSSIFKIFKAHSCCHGSVPTKKGKKQRQKRRNRRNRGGIVKDGDQSDEGKLL